MRSAEASFTQAPSATSGVMVSLAGLAVMRFPATVARLRICGAPTCQAALTSGKARSRSSLEDAAALCVTSGPRWMVSSFIERDAVQARQARDVDDRLDAFTHAALEFEHQVGGPGNQAGFFAFFRQQVQGFLEGYGGEVIIPHTVIKPQSSARCHLALL